MKIQHKPRPSGSEDPIERLFRIVCIIGRRALMWFVFILLGTFASVLIWTFSWPETDPTHLPTADAILCLGGDMTPDGTLGPAARARTEKCQTLLEAGVAPVILFSGGGASAGGPAEAVAMRAYALSQSNQIDQFLVEPSSQSTLQNALFSLPLLPEAQSIVIVTEAFHLPRAQASFRWAAWELGRSITITGVMSHPVRRDPSTGALCWRCLVRETAAIWFNLARSIAYSILPGAQTDWLE